MPASPRSWVVRQFGDPAHALSLETVEPRTPNHGEVRVAVDAVGLNFPDLLVCAGRYQERPEPPFSPGFEAAGTVVATGPGSRFEPGQRVIVVPELPNGALQTSLTVSDAQLYPVPDSMPASVAGTLHIAYQTAHLALHHRGGLRPSEWVLVTGASGGVGSAAVQLAKAAGGRVIALATGAAKANACRTFGADVVIDLAAEPEPDPVEAIRATTDRRGVDLIVDAVGGPLLDRIRRAIAFEGRLVIVGFAAGEITALPANHVLLRNYAVLGLHLARYRRENPALLRDVHEQLVRLWHEGAIAPHIHRELPFDEALDGLAMVAGREAVGRVVLLT